MSSDAAKLPRDQRYDLVRGIALICIMVNHTYAPNDVEMNIGHIGFFDYADVFVFVSGILCGMSAFAGFERHGFLATQIKFLKRCGQIYIGYLITVAACVAIVYAFANSVNLKFADFQMDGIATNPFWTAFLIATTAKQVYVVGILKLYMLLIPLAPILVLIYKKNRLALAGIAMAAYVYSQIRWHAGLPNTPQFLGTFVDPLAWILIFALGIAVGVERKRGNLLIPKSAPVQWLAVLGSIALCVGFYLEIAPPVLFEKFYARPLRIINLAVVAVAFAMLVPAKSHLWAYLWPVTKLGSNSLIGFCVGIFTTNVVILFCFQQNADLPLYLVCNLIAILLLVASSLLLIKIRSQWLQPLLNTLMARPARHV